MLSCQCEHSCMDMAQDEQQPELPTEYAFDMGHKWI